MSMLSVVSLRCLLHYPALTWCRTLYIRQRINLSTGISRACSSFDKRDGNSNVPDDSDSNSSPPYQHSSKFDHRRKHYSDQFSSKYINRRNSTDSSRFDMRREQKSKYGRRLFKERDISDADREAEIKDAEMLKNLPDSERFGTGIGNFLEKTSEKSGKAGKQTVLPKNWSNTFGTMPVSDEGWKKEKSALAENEKYWDDLEQEDKTAKFYNHVRLARYNRRHVPNWYARRIVKLGKKGQIREAIEVFDKWMIEQDRVKPTGFEFSVLIKLLAEVGYTEKAFSLYYQMLSMRIYCEDQIYSSLFNACANSPWPEDGLKWANKLHRAMLVKGVSPNYITYLAMIKAFGRNGDINTAFTLADEAVELQCDEHLLSNLLTACISDKEAGFRHAVVVWRKFRKLRVQPSLISYNLLLRSVKECGIGDPELVNRLLGGGKKMDRNFGDRKRFKEIKSSSNNTESTIRTMPYLIEEDKQNQDDVINYTKAEGKLRNNFKSFHEIDKLLQKYQLTEEENQIYDTNEVDFSKEDSKTAAGNETRELQPRKEWWELDVFENSVNAVSLRNSEVESSESSEINLPNILNPNENFSSVIHVEAVTHKEDRLALLGGMNGFLRTLQEENIQPNIVTYTQLVEIVPGHLEDILIDEMWAAGVQPDIDFYNLLIRKRVKYDKRGVWELYDRLKLEENLPDIRTFSCLALACVYKEDGLQLIEDMMAADLMPNQYTLHALLTASRYNFGYKKEILLKMQELGIQPTVRFIETVEKQISNAKRTLADMERNKSGSNTEKKKMEKFRWKLQGFLHFYDKWAQHNILEEEHHPWKHFRESKEEVNKG